MCPGSDCSKQRWQPTVGSDSMDVRTVAVIGAGTMGAGIAQVCAQTGWETRLYDAFPEGLQNGMDSIHGFWDKGIARGKTTEQQKS
ncbi:MAG TPA: hypothetical protein D7H75_04845, partial [Candidatus Poseidoniales archaeon]